ncbi:MerR family transcriptional regulator [Streptomyces sp. ODS28]|uniref:MerR family transcriptional regulator n=1 Tax=Streptomyces sp. ODS28 TaxID=3136688 RepID=UPI0031EC6037
MRIGELARRTDVPAPTIKYYTREGLLPPGERTGPNQVRYGEAHVRRLRLIRALLDVGGLSVAAARDLLSEADAYEGAEEAAEAPDATPDAPSGTEAECEVDELARRYGWSTDPDNPGRRALVRIVAACRDLGRHELLGLLDRYADAVRQLAAAERELAPRAGEGAVLATVLGDAALTAMRRMSQDTGTPT